MNHQPLGAVLGAALIAGLAAGLLVAAFHFVATEPVIDLAVELEEELRGAEGHHEEEIVSREAQRVGLIVGFALYGLIWALLFGGVYHLAQPWLAGLSAAQKGLLLAGAAYWAVALFPSLKFPANPPGVGEPDTIVFRQALYLAVLGLSIAGTAAALALSRSAPGRLPMAAGFLVLYFAGLYLLLPHNPDPVPLPADLVAQFRVLSVIGLTLFWAVLGLTFSYLLRRRSTLDRQLEPSGSSG